MLPEVQAVYDNGHIYLSTQNMVLSCNQYGDDAVKPIKASLREINAAAKKLKAVSAQMTTFGFPQCEPELAAKYYVD